MVTYKFGLQALDFQMAPPFITRSDVTPKKAGVHKLALLDRAHVFRHAMRDGGIDGVFRDITLDAEIVVAGRVVGERAALAFDLVGRLPGERLSAKARCSELR
jgi:hypothetical protein